MGTRAQRSGVGMSVTLVMLVVAGCSSDDEGSGLTRFFGKQIESCQEIWAPLPSGAIAERTCENLEQIASLDESLFDATPSMLADGTPDDLRRGLRNVYFLEYPDTSTAAEQANLLPADAKVSRVGWHWSNGGDKVELVEATVHRVVDGAIEVAYVYFDDHPFVLVVAAAGVLPQFKFYRAGGRGPSFYLDDPAA